MNDRKLEIIRILESAPGDGWMPGREVSERMDGMLWYAGMRELVLCGMARQRSGEIGRDFLLAPGWEGVAECAEAVAYESRVLDQVARALEMTVAPATTLDELARKTGYMSAIVVAATDILADGGEVRKLRTVSRDDFPQYKLRST